MQAIVNSEYGPPEDLELGEIDPPAVDDDGVLVRVRAASVNPFDWHAMRGHAVPRAPDEGLRRPKQPVRGVDMAGTVEAVGTDVTRFRPGRRGVRRDAAARSPSTCAARRRASPKPASLSFEQAAAVPMAALHRAPGAARQGRLQPGQRVLINGAAGGVGTFAVQIAKAFGADVTGVCSTRNVELVRSIGADQVIDYTAEDFTQGRPALRPDRRRSPGIGRSPTFAAR